MNCFSELKIRDYFFFVNSQYNCLAVGDYSHLSHGVNQMHGKKSCINWPLVKIICVKNQMYNKHIIFINQIASCM